MEAVDFPVQRGCVIALINIADQQGRGVDTVRTDLQIIRKQTPLRDRQITVQAHVGQQATGNLVDAADTPRAGGYRNKEAVSRALRLTTQRHILKGRKAECQTRGGRGIGHIGFGKYPVQ